MLKALNLWGERSGESVQVGNFQTMNGRSPFLE
jgi:hypothetical protein